MCSVFDSGILKQEFFEYINGDWKIVTGFGVEEARGVLASISEGS